LDKRRLKLRVRLLLGKPAPPGGDLGGELEAMGFSGGEIDNELVLLYCVYKKALDGHLPAFNALQNLLGIDDGSAALDIKRREFLLKRAAAKRARSGAEQADRLVRLIEGLGDDE